MSDIVELSQVSPVLNRARAAAYWELTKPRIAGMVVLVTAIGFFLVFSADTAAPLVPLLLSTLLGTAMVGAGANALNQYFEANLDRRMVRTQDRPLPSQRLTGGEALGFAAIISVAGVLVLAVGVNLLTAVIAAFSLLSYTFVYTPLKRRTGYSVFIGAVPGALPPVMGWTAASGSLSLGALLLFAILYFWQLPHFAAIAWLYREDYSRGGFPVLSVTDPTGRKTSRHLMTFSVVLLAVSLLPSIAGLAGPGYAIGAFVFGVAFLGFGRLFCVRRTNEAARLHLLASIIYLPALFALMIVDKIVLN